MTRYALIAALLALSCAHKTVATTSAISQETTKSTATVATAVEEKQHSATETTSSKRVVTRTYRPDGRTVATERVEEDSQVQASHSASAEATSSSARATVATTDERRAATKTVTVTTGRWKWAAGIGAVLVGAVAFFVWRNRRWLKVLA